MKRIRDRRNRYGRGSTGNRCGHDPRRRRAPPSLRKHALPPFLHLACMKLRATELPLLLGRYARRSELDEAVKAVAEVMLCRTDIPSGRIGRPSRRDRRRFDGLSVDYDLAPLANVGESRVERVIGTLVDWGFLHFAAVPTGRRKAKRGFLRCAAQPIERLADGQRRGRAAVRVWTDAFWRWLGAAAALTEARNHAAAAAAADQAARRLPVRELVSQLAEAHAHPDAAPRERPPP